MRFPIVRRLLGVDCERLPRLSRFSSARRLARRIQREIHEWAIHSARGIVFDSRGPHPRLIPKLFLPGNSLAVLRNPARDLTSFSRRFVVTSNKPDASN